MERSLFKEYKTRLYEGSRQCTKRVYDEVFGVEFKDFYDGKTIDSMGLVWIMLDLKRPFPRH